MKPIFYPIKKSAQKPRLPQDSDSNEPLSTMLFLALLLVHILIARIEQTMTILVTFHGLVTLIAGLVYGSNPRRPDRTLMAVAYICGAEVLWRMCSHSGVVFWEFGKYAAALVLMVATIRASRFRYALLPGIYFVLLLPAVAITLTQESLGDAKQSLSGNLSGPLLLAVSLAFMSQLRLSPRQICRIFCCYVVPLAGVAFLCYSSTFGATEIEFGTSSNKAASGGLAPNQVSATLGFGILCGLLCVLLDPKRRRFNLPLLGLTLWFAVQSGLTFSRSGLYLAGLSLFAGIMPLLRSSNLRWSVVFGALTVVCISYFVVLPGLNRFTGGSFQERFQSTDLSNRDLIWKSEMNIWANHPLFGAGVGESDELRMTSHQGEVRAHTEYTRLLADHGLLGLSALAVLLLHLVRSFGFTQPGIDRGLYLAMTAFGLLFMTVSATRLAVFAVALGLGAARTGVGRKFTFCTRLSDIAYPRLPKRFVIQTARERLRASAV